MNAKSIGKRVIWALIGGVGALMGSLASMEGGMTMTGDQLGSIPLIAWLGVIMATLSGFVKGDTPIKEQLK